MSSLHLRGRMLHDGGSDELNSHDALQATAILTLVVWLKFMVSNLNLGGAKAKAGKRCGGVGARAGRVEGGRG
jgi:hypothetical protein